MRVLIRHEIELKDAELCLGCPYAQVKGKGIDYEGEGCDCGGKDRRYCRCSPIREVRNKDKDKWHCKAHGFSLGVGQIPKRPTSCKADFVEDKEEIKRLASQVAELRREIKMLNGEIAKRGSKIKEKDKLLKNFADPEFWAQVAKSKI